MSDVDTACPRGEVLITGASGFLGSHLSEMFARHGYAVRALVRRTSSLRWLVNGDGRARRGVTLVEGDVRDPASLEAAVRGVDVVVHNAGYIGADPETNRLVNAEGSANVARAVAAARAAGDGPARLVYVSSQAASGPSRSGAARTEDEAPAPVTAYGREKLAGERACFDLAGGAEVVAIRPPSIYGPRDVGFLPTVRLVARHIQPVTGVLGPRLRMSVVHVADVAEAVRLAATHPAAAGRVYFVTDGEPHPLERVTGSIRAALGTWAAPLPVVPVIVRGTRLASAAWTLLTRREGLVSAERARQIFAGEWIVSAERIARELGFRASHALDPGFAETVAWYRAVGWLRPARGAGRAEVAVSGA